MLGGRLGRQRRAAPCPMTSSTVCLEVISPSAQKVQVRSDHCVAGEQGNQAAERERRAERNADTTAIARLAACDYHQPDQDAREPARSALPARRTSRAAGPSPRRASRPPMPMPRGEATAARPKKPPAAAPAIRRFSSPDGSRALPSTIASTAAVRRSGWESGGSRGRSARPARAPARSARRARSRRRSSG